MTVIDSLASAFANQSKAENEGQVKESERLKKEPFKTKYPPSNKKVEDQLRGWRPPPNDEAYILLEKKFIERGDVNKDTIQYTLFVMLVGHRPDILEHLRYNLMVKGMRILHWDRFPKYNDPMPKRAELALMHYDRKAGKTAYDALEEALISFSENGVFGSDASRVIAELKAANDDLMKKLADKRSKDKDKSEEVNK